MLADDIVSLRNLYDRVESHIRGLKGLGVASDSYGSLLSSVLLKKLPRELCLIISREVSEDDWTLDKLMEALEEELKAREHLQHQARVQVGARKLSHHHSHQHHPLFSLVVRLSAVVTVEGVIPQSHAEQ